LWLEESWAPETKTVVEDLKSHGCFLTIQCSTTSQDVAYGASFTPAFARLQNDDERTALLEQFGSLTDEQKSQIGEFSLQQVSLFSNSPNLSHVESPVVVKLNGCWIFNDAAFAAFVMLSTTDSGLARTFPAPATLLAKLSALASIDVVGVKLKAFSNKNDGKEGSVGGTAYIIFRVRLNNSVMQLHCHSSVDPGQSMMGNITAINFFEIENPDAGDKEKEVRDRPNKSVKKPTAKKGKQLSDKKQSDLDAIVAAENALFAKLLTAAEKSQLVSKADPTVVFGSADATKKSNFDIDHPAEFGQVRSGQLLDWLAVSGKMEKAFVETPERYYPKDWNKCIAEVLGKPAPISLSKQEMARVVQCVGPIDVLDAVAHFNVDCQLNLTIEIEQMAQKIAVYTDDVPLLLKCLSWLATDGQSNAASNDSELIRKYLASLVVGELCDQKAAMRAFDLIVPPNDAVIWAGTRLLVRNAQGLEAKVLSITKPKQLSPSPPPSPPRRATPSHYLDVVESDDVTVRVVGNNSKRSLVVNRVKFHAFLREWEEATRYRPSARGTSHYWSRETQFDMVIGMYDDLERFILVA